MTRKVLSLLMCIALMLSACACGSKTEEPEVKPGESVELDDGAIDPADANFTEAEALPDGGDRLYSFGGQTEFNFYVYYNDEAQNWAGIEAIDTVSKKRLWTYQTEPVYVGQYDSYTVLGPTIAGFIFTEEDEVYCLDMMDGSVDWKSEPLGFNPCGYYAIDDSCCFYFPCYYKFDITVIGQDGSIVNKYTDIKDPYGCELGDVWCNGISVGSDGMLKVNYANMVSTVYVFDPVSGTCVDEYPYSISIAPEMLIGDWVDGYYSESSNMSLYVDDNLNFVLTTYKDNQVSHVYNGRFIIDTYVDEVGNDWLRTELTSCDDDMFADWGSIGDYVVSYYYSDPSGDFPPCIELTQINNGDSVMGYYYEEYMLILNKIESVG